MTRPASGNASTRAADTDRIEVAQLLTDAAASGVLGLTEYEDRLAKAYAATTYDELDRLSNDLPGAVTRGRWNVPKRMTTFALWGGGVIDMRYADFTSHDVEIRSYSIMGGQTILVPPEVNLDLHGKAVMGSFEHDVNGDGSPGAPCVKIRGLSLWGSVGVKRKKRKPA